MYTRKITFNTLSMVYVNVILDANYRKMRQMEKTQIMIVYKIEVIQTVFHNEGRRLTAFHLFICPHLWGKCGLNAHPMVLELPPCQ